MFSSAFPLCSSHFKWCFAFSHLQSASTWVYLVPHVFLYTSAWRISSKHWRAVLGTVRGSGTRQTVLCTISNHHFSLWSNRDFPSQKTHRHFFFSVLGSFSLPKPPKSDIWCWWAITGVSICPWLTVCLHITAVQSDTVLAALLDTRSLKRKWGLLRVYFCSSLLSAFPSSVTVQDFTHERE